MSDPTARPAAQGLSAWQLRTVLAVLLSGQLLSALDLTVVGTALPTMVGELGELDAFPLVVVAYLVAETVAMALYGKLADIFGAKPLYLVAIGVFTAGSAFVGLSGSLPQLVAARAVQGVGAGGLVVLAFTIASSVIPPRHIGRIQGLVGAMYALASLVGPLVGGTLTEHASWRWCFLLNVPIGVLGLVAVATLVRLPRPEGRRRVDYPGALLLTTGVATLVLATVWGGTRYPWTSAPVLSLLAVAVVCGVGLVLWERRAADPIVPFALFGTRVIGVAMAITFLVGIAVIGGYFFLPIYLQVVRGATPMAAGLQLLPLMVAVMIGSGLSGWLITRTGRIRPVVVAGAATMLVSLGLFATVDAGTPLWTLWAFEVVLGTGMGMVISKLIVAVQDSVRKRDLGTITAQAGFVRTIGSAIGTAALGAVLTARLAAAPVADRVDRSGQIVHSDPATIRGLADTDPAAHDAVIGAFADGLQTVFLIAVPVMALAFLLSWLLPDTRLREGQSPWGDDAGAPDSERTDPPVRTPAHPDET